MTPLRQRMLGDLQIRHYFARHHSHLPTFDRRVRSSLQQATRPTWSWAHSPVPAFPHERQRGVPVHLHPDGLRCASSIPHAQPEDHHRAHPVSAVRTKTADDCESRRSESAAGSATRSSSLRATVTLRCVTSATRTQQPSRPTSTRAAMWCGRARRKGRRESVI